MDSTSLANGKPQSSFARSRVGNGSKLLPNNDGRSLWARIMRDTLSALLAHCGGSGEISETRRMAARRVATLESELIFLEDKFATARAAGNEPNHNELDLYGRLADRQRRLSEPLGWDRTPRDVTPTIEQIAEELAAEEEAERAQRQAVT